jgi:hypothetical protein
LTTTQNVEVYNSGVTEQVTPYNENAPLWFETSAFMENIGCMSIDIMELHYTGKMLFQVDVLFRRKVPVDGIPSYLNPNFNISMSSTT